MNLDKFPFEYVCGGHFRCTLPDVKFTVHGDDIVEMMKLFIALAPKEEEKVHAVVCHGHSHAFAVLACYDKSKAEAEAKRLNTISPAARLGDEVYQVDEISLS